VAGREKKLFEDAAIARIAAATGGTPRKINILCDTALVYGFSQEAEAIGPEIVEEVLRDKARFGVMGGQGVTKSVLGPGASGWVTAPVDERAGRARDDAAARAVLLAMFDGKK
jgi:hypothetical protein